MSEQTLDEYTRCGIPAIRVLAREIVGLQMVVARLPAEIERQRIEAEDESANEATNRRLDSHNRVMESIVRRVRVLEQQARPFQEDGHLAVQPRSGCYCWEYDDAVKAAKQRAETAERERDEWQASANRRLDEREAALAKVDRLREALAQIVATPGGEHRGKGRDRYYALNGYERVHAIATAALEDA